MPNPPACSSERIVETYRDHTSSCARMHKFGPVVGYDYRKGTIRGFLGVLAIVGAFVAATVALVPSGPEPKVSAHSGNDQLSQEKTNGRH